MRLFEHEDSLITTLWDKRLGRTYSQLNMSPKYKIGIERATVNFVLVSIDFRKRIAQPIGKEIYIK